MKLFAFKKSQSAINIFLPIISLFMLGVLLLISGLIAYTAAGTILAAFPSVDGLDTVINQVLGLYTLYDYGILIIAIFFIIAIGYTSYRIRAHPMYYIITIFTSAFYGFVAYMMSYIYAQFASNSVFTIILYMFPLSILLLTNLHWIAFAMIVVAAVTLYSKDPKSEIPLR